jgi:hypothetical protein
MYAQHDGQPEFCDETAGMSDQLSPGHKAGAILFNCAVESEAICLQQFFE